jgi:hypothetical protein
MQKDLQYLSAGVPELETYLLSKELYYPIGMSLPQLTLGGILLSLAKAGNDALQFQAQVDAVRSRWKTAWETKSRQEVHARSELWANYLNEYRGDPRSGKSLYSQNVRYRAMLTLLGQSTHEMDGFLKSVFIEGQFVWEANCELNFDRPSFWFLFGNLK